MSKAATRDRGERVNIYVPNIHIRGDDVYRYVKWWNGTDAHYAHLFRDDPTEGYQIRAIGINDRTIYSGTDLPPALIPNRVRKQLPRQDTPLTRGEGE